MCQYYFDIIDCDGQCVDEEGSEWPDIEAARMSAIKGIRSLLSTAVLAGSLNLSGLIRVRDQNGACLLEVPFEDALVVS